MYSTWYILEDGRKADPAEVAPDADGVLRHSSGVAVAVGPHGPLSSMVVLADMVAAPAVKPVKARAYRTAEMKAAD
jgi:hypothetical protein